MIGTILFVTFLVLLVIGAPIALCLGAAALLVVFTTGDVSPIVLGQRMFGSLDSFTIKLISYSLTPVHHLYGIRSLISLSKL